MSGPRGHGGGVSSIPEGDTFTLRAGKSQEWRGEPRLSDRFRVREGSARKPTGGPPGANGNGHTGCPPSGPGVFRVVP